MPAACAYTYGCPPSLSFTSFSLFICFPLQSFICLFSSILNHSTAATKRENSRKDEGPTGTGAQYKQGNIVIIFVAVIIMMRTLCCYGSHACPSQNFSKWSRLILCWQHYTNIVLFVILTIKSCAFEERIISPDTMLDECSMPFLDISKHVSSGSCKYLGQHLILNSQIQIFFHLVIWQDDDTQNSDIMFYFKLCRQIGQLC